MNIRVNVSTIYLFKLQLMNIYIYYILVFIVSDIEHEYISSIYFCLLPLMNVQEYISIIYSFLSSLILYFT